MGDAVDDSADKLRRNLVVFSAAVIAAEFLGVKITDYLPFLSGPSKEAAEVFASLKGRVLTVVVFLYILARWSSSNELQKAEKELRLRWLLSLQSFITEVAVANVDRAKKAEELPQWMKVEPDIDGFSQFKSKIAAFDAVGNTLFPSSWEKKEFWGDAPKFSFRLERVRRSLIEPEGGLSGIAAKVHINVPGGLLAIIKLRLACAFLVKAQPALAVIAPKILALVALVILLTKLFQ